MTLYARVSGCFFNGGVAMMPVSLIKGMSVLKFRCLVAGLLVVLSSGLATASSAEPWLQIQQPLFQLIFPPEQEAEAQRVVTLLNQYLAEHLQDLPIEGDFKPVPIVLFAQSHVSNGKVGLPPFRSHWYNKPMPLTGLEWYDTLAVHEGRHMVQYQQYFDHETGTWLHFFFGESGVALFSRWLIPDWYAEGDAVWAETVLTSAGRGRNAAFNLWLRTDLLNNSPYRYERAMLGTGFDRTPYLSPYVLGYFFTDYLQSRYDTGLMDRVLANTGTLSSVSFNGALQDQTGLNLNEHYDQWISQRTQQWQQQLDALSLTEVLPLLQNPSDSWRSWYPVGVRGDEIIAVEVDVTQGSFLVAVRNGQSRRLTDLSPKVTASYVSGAKSKAVFLADDRVCWVVSVRHATRPDAGSANLECWSDAAGLAVVLSDQKITAASYADGEFLVHEFRSDRSSALVVYSADGQRLSDLALPQRALVYDIAPSRGSWVFVMQLDDGHGIFHVNGALTDLTLLRAANQENLRAPLLTNNWLLYSSDASGIDQLQAMSRNQFDSYQVMSRPYGTYFPVYDVDSNRLIAADYTAKGQQLIAVDFDDAMQVSDAWQPQSVANNLPMTIHKGAQVERARAEVLPYRRSSNLWNPHSWSLNYDSERLVGEIQSTDVFGRLNVTTQLGLQQSQADWLGSVNVNWLTDEGTQLGYLRQRDFLSSGEAFTLHGLSLAAPQVSEKGALQQRVQPEFRLIHIMPEELGSLTLAAASLGYVSSRAPAYQDINVPWGFAQNLTGQLALQTGGVVLLSDTSGVQRGFNHKASVEWGLQAQYRVGDIFSLLPATIFFPDSLQEELTTRTRLTYRHNFGAIGQTLTPALYWRNTELSLTAVGQQDSALTSAVGVTLSPNINLFRNASVMISPSFSVYYQLNTQQWSIYYQLGLAGW